MGDLTWKLTKAKKKKRLKDVAQVVKCLPKKAHVPPQYHKTELKLKKKKKLAPQQPFQRSSSWKIFRLKKIKSQKI
jgi:hypothetical protein